MSAGYAWTAWLFWIGGAAIALAALLLFGWSLWWDRARGRRRCPRCWYDMSGAIAADDKSFTCSECGKKVTRERQLFKTRRRWRWAALALLLLVVSAYIALQPKVQRDGWWSIVPNQGLIWAWIALDDFNFDIYNEMMRRDSFFHEGWDRMIEHCVAGDFRARPISEEWKRKYGEVLRHFRANFGHRRSERTERIWRSLPAEVHFEAPADWPEGVPISIQIKIGQWWRYMKHRAVVHITPQLEGAQTRILRDDGWLTLPALPSGDYEIVFELRIEQETMHENRQEVLETREIGSHSAAVPVRVKGELGDYLDAADSAVIRQAIADRLSPRIVRGGVYPDGRHQYLLRTDDSVWSDPIFDDHALGIALELVANDEVIWRSEYVTRIVAARNTARSRSEVENYLALWNPEQLDAAAERGDAFEVRIRGEPQIALRVHGKRKFWCGEIRLPAPVLSSDPDRER